MRKRSPFTRLRLDMAVAFGTSVKLLATDRAVSGLRGMRPLDVLHHVGRFFEMIPQQASDVTNRIKLEEWTSKERW
jgi:hypothetical protein